MKTRDRWSVWVWRLGILAFFLGAWEYLTGIEAISKTPGLYWIDPFFISRPSVIAQRFLYLTSDKVRLTIWQMALSTIQSTLWGFLVASPRASPQGWCWGEATGSRGSSTRSSWPSTRCRASRWCRSSP
jgi:ABC-type nitrate/sulfonate/bicarbonate transport system permease component